MESWDICSLDVAAHHPQVLRSDDETRAIAIHLPAGEELQEHQVHERTYLLVAGGEIEIAHDGSKVNGGPGFLAHFGPNDWRCPSLCSPRRGRKRTSSAGLNWVQTIM